MKESKQIHALLLSFAVITGAVVLSGCRNTEAENRVEITGENGKCVGTLSYTTDNGEATLTGFSYGNIAIEIPAEIDGNTVIGIADNAFFSDAFLSEIYLPDTVSSVGAKSFAGCKKLSGVYTTGNPDRVVLDATACEGSSVRSIEKGSASDSESYLCNAEYTYKEHDGGVYITGYKVGMTVDIPSEIDGTAVRRLGTSVFSRTDNLEEVVIPDSVSEISSYAFYDCEDLKYVVIPDTLSRISDFTFFDCENLQGVKKRSTDISGADLTSICNIGEWAFGGCEKLERIEFSENLTTIGRGAFSRCASIISAEIPASVNMLESSVFDDCSGLQYISVREENKSYCDIDGVLFNKKQTEILKCPEGREGEYIIPTTVNTIGEYALKNCLVTTVPKSVTTIKYGGLSMTGQKWDSIPKEHQHLRYLSLPDTLVYADGAVCSGRKSLGSGVNPISFCGKTYDGDEFYLHRSINSFPFARL